MSINKTEIDQPDNPWSSKYTESMCLEIIKMFEKGETRSEFCARHDICNDTFEKWRKRHHLFNRACQIAHEKARAYYDNLRREYLIEEQDGATINWSNFNRMYNVRFNIPDKRRVTVKALGRAKNERNMLKSIMSAVSRGELTPEEAQKLANLIDVSLKVKEKDELEERIKQIEKAQQIGVDESEFEEVPDE